MSRTKCGEGRIGGFTNPLHVTQLLLYYNSLGGTIPDSLTNLLKLKDLDLQGNYISGHIPATLAIWSYCIPRAK